MEALQAQAYCKAFEEAELTSKNQTRIPAQAAWKPGLVPTILAANKQLDADMAHQVTDWANKPDLQDYIQQKFPRFTDAALIQ